MDGPCGIPKFWIWSLAFQNYMDGPCCLHCVHRLDREGSGITLMGRSKESISHLHWLFSDINRTKSSFKAGNDACYQWYWALIIGTPKENEGLIRAPLTKVVLNGGKSQRVMFAYGCGLEAFQEAVTEYRVLGPTISGCSWIELRPLTNHKYQV
ncbi:putative pseudouridine synthase, RsuA/RluA, pseudouridine synthase, catalytic domain superfamily [Helianthus anomalus]